MSGLFDTALFGRRQRDGGGSGERRRLRGFGASGRDHQDERNGVFGERGDGRAAVAVGVGARNCRAVRRRGGATTVGGARGRVGEDGSSSAASVGGGDRRARGAGSVAERRRRGDRRRRGGVAAGGITAVARLVHALVVVAVRLQLALELGVPCREPDLTLRQADGS